MRIKVWGCRGSIATPGPSTNRYGGNTTCVEVRLDSGHLIIFDAGSGLRGLGKSLCKEEATTEFYIFLTHAHWDHLAGFPFFLPAYSPKYSIHVRGGPKAKGALESFLKQQMQPPYFPVPYRMMNARFDFTQGGPRKRNIGEAEVIPIPISHPNGGYGFKVIENGVSFVFIPDNELDYRHEGGLTRDEYIDFVRSADLLMHDSQYSDEEYRLKRTWGHTPFSTTVRLGVDAGVKRLGLFHHDPDHSDCELDRFEESARTQVSTGNSDVEVFAVREGMEISLFGDP